MWPANLWRWLFGLGIIATSLNPCLSFVSDRPRLPVSPRVRPSIDALHAEVKQKPQGVYTRPSGAIERGSGFFVPGLEGPRVRFVVGGILLLLTAVNRVLAGSDGALSLEESLAVGYSFIVLFQAGIESARPNGGAPAPKQKRVDISGGADASSATIPSWLVSSQIPGESRDRIIWSLTSYLALTPTAQTAIVLEKGSGIAYVRGKKYYISHGGGESAAETAYKLLSTSAGGRLSLPATHPIVSSLVQDSSDSIRSAILQKVNDTTCILILSDQLLAGYTSQDLTWLGRLASYSGDVSS